MEIVIELNIETLRQRLIDAGLWGHNPQDLADGIERILSVLYIKADRVEVVWSETGVQCVHESGPLGVWDRDVFEDVERVMELLLRAWGGERLVLEGELVEEVILEAEEPDGVVWAREAYWEGRR